MTMYSRWPSHLLGSIYETELVQEKVRPNEAEMVKSNILACMI